MVPPSLIYRLQNLRSADPGCLSEASPEAPVRYALLVTKEPSPEQGIRGILSEKRSTEVSVSSLDRDQQNHQRDEQTYDQYDNGVTCDPVRLFPALVNKSALFGAIDKHRSVFSVQSKRMSTHFRYYVQTLHRAHS